MNNQKSHIPTGDAGEIYLDLIDMYWYRCDSTCYIKEKTIPFIKILINLVGARVKYNANQLRLGRREYLPQIIKDIIKTSGKIIQSFVVIKDLSTNLFCTGDI